jgi:hypothetical protein
MSALGGRKRVFLGVLGLLLVAGAVGWRVFRVSDMATIGAGYAAEQTCACLFVAHRALPSCLTDLEPLAQRLISVQPGDNQVTASGFGLATATARYEKGFGCSLLN